MKKNDVYELSKNAWYFRLLKYIFNLDYHDFSHVCPLFWLTLSALIISPVVLPIAFVVRLIAAKVKSVKEENIKEFEEWAAIYYHDISVNEKSFNALKETDFWNDKTNKRMYRFVYEYLPYVNFEMYRILDIIGLEKRAPYRKAKKDKKKRNKERINRMLRYITPIGKAILFVFAIIGVCLAGCLVIFVIDFFIHLGHKGWVNVGLIILIIFGVLMLTLGIASIEENMGPRTRAKFGKIFREFFIVITTPFIGLWFLIKKCGQFITMIFSDYCPAIKFK